MRDGTVLIATSATAVGAYLIWRRLRSTETLRMMVELLDAPMAGAIAKTACAPLEVGKLTSQVQSMLWPDAASRSTCATLAAVADDRGILGLWAGNLINVLITLPRHFSHVMLKDVLKAALPQHESEKSYAAIATSVVQNVPPS